MDSCSSLGRRGFASRNLEEWDAGFPWAWTTPALLVLGSAAGPVIFPSVFVGELGAAAETLRCTGKGCLRICRLVCAARKCRDTGDGKEEKDDLLIDRWIVKTKTKTRSRCWSTDFAK